MSFNSESDKLELISSSVDGSGSYGSVINQDDLELIQFPDATADAIRQCDKFILTPYSNALKLIGWLPYSATQRGYVVQTVLVVMWFLCISATMVTQTLSCFKRDALSPGQTDLKPPTNDNLIYSAFTDNTSATSSPPAATTITCNDHTISSYILPDLIVLVTYLYGVYMFVRGGAEDLFSLASHVFIKNAQAESSSKNLIKTIECLFIVGVVWLIFSLIVRTMTAAAVQLFDANTTIVWQDLTFSGGAKITLLLISLLGFFTFDALYMFSVLHYVAQAEMNIYLISDVSRLIEIHRFKHIDGVIKETEKCKEYLDALNDRTATLTSLALFVLLNLALSSIIGLNGAENLPVEASYKIVAGVTVFLNIICWCLMASLPFIQAARVSYWCDRLKDLAPEIRGRVSAAYKNDSLLDLDSLLNYLQKVHLEAYLFGVPISPQLLYLFITAFSFTMLVLLQNDTYSVGRYI